MTYNDAHIISFVGNVHILTARLRWYQADGVQDRGTGPAGFGACVKASMTIAERRGEMLCCCSGAAEGIEPRTRRRRRRRPTMHKQRLYSLTTDQTD